MVIRLEKRIEAVEQRINRVRERRAFKEAQKEVEAIVSAKVAEYNSPEAKARRQAEYEELCRVGELRHQAFLRGEDPDKYPLPWEKKEKTEEQLEMERIMQEIMDAVG